MLTLVKRCKDAYPYRLGLIVGKNISKIDEIVKHNVHETINIIDVGMELSAYYIYERLKFSGATTEAWLKERLENEKGTIVLKNTEILFTKSMALDVLKIFKGYSRNRVVIASILGKIDKQKLYIGSRYDEDYKVYDVSDIKVIKEI